MNNAMAAEYFDHGIAVNSLAPWYNVATPGASHHRLVDGFRLEGPEHMAEAYSLAISGRPGPVVLALPEDVLAEEADVGDGARVEAPRTAPRGEDLARLRALLAAAERPLVVAGEGGWTAATSLDVQAFCEANALPVAVAFRCQDFVDNRSSSYAGVLGVAMDEAIATRLRDADLVLAIGGRLGEVPTRRYTLLQEQTLIHVHPDPTELGRVYEPTLGIAATLTEFSAALRALDPVEPSWRDWTTSWHVS
jgi:acetolactate synthase-1/2/3 large subunit